jgi:hypothetical protein
MLLEAENVGNFVLFSVSVAYLMLITLDEVNAVLFLLKHREFISTKK